MEKLLEHFNKLSLTSIAQACENRGVMDENIMPVWPAKVCGRALTVEVQPEYGRLSESILEEINEETILVINAFKYESSFLDELQQCRIKKSGAVAVITDGTVRNAANWKKIGLPVFAKGICDRMQEGKEKAPVGKTILCGGAAISKGDYVFADNDGVVVIPQNDIERVLKKAEQIERHRNNLLMAL